MPSTQQQMNEFVLLQRAELLALMVSVDPWVREALLEFFDRNVRAMVTPKAGLPLGYDVVGDTTLQ